MTEELVKESGNWTTIEDVAIHVAAVKGTESTIISILDFIKTNPKVLIHSLLMEIWPLTLGYDCSLVLVAPLSVRLRGKSQSL